MVMVSDCIAGGCTVGRATGRTMGCAMAGALMAVPAGRAAGVASTMLALASPGGVVTSAQSLFSSLLLSSLFAECSEMVGAAMHVALLSICWALGRGMGIATLVAVGVL